MDMSVIKLWEIVKERKAWCAAVYVVAKSWTWLSDWTEMLLYTICSLTLIYNYCFINRIEKKELKAKSIVILAFIFTYITTFTYIYLFLLLFLLSWEKWKWKLLSCVRQFVTLWTVARQAPLSMGFSRQEYWNWLPFPSPGDLPNPGIELGSPALQADSLPSEAPGNPMIL